MVTFLLRCLVKAKTGIIFLFIILTLSGLFALKANQVVRKFIPAFVDLGAERLKLKISFQTVRYDFPRAIIIKEFKIFDARSLEKPIIQIPLVKLDLSFSFFSSKEPIHLSKAELISTSIRLPALKDYLTRNGPLLWEDLRQLPQADFKLSLTDTNIYLFKDSQIASPLKVDADFTFSKGTFMAKLKDTASFMQLWGNWAADRFSWKGFVFYNGHLTTEPLYILDIKGQAGIKDKSLILEDLSFVINGDRIQAQGNYRLKEPFDFQGQVAYIKKIDHIRIQNPLKKIEMKFYGQMSPRKVLVNGQVNFDLLSDTQLGLPLKRGSIEFQDLNMRVINDKLLQVRIKHSQGALWTSIEHRISFDRFLASIKRGKSAQFIAALSTQLYGGRYSGQLSLDTTSEPWQIESNGKLEGLEINRLSEVISYFGHCTGYLSGNLNIKAPRNLSVRGSVVVNRADINDFSFLPWGVSKIFQMPSLDHLSGTDLSLRFSLDNKATKVDDLKLHSDDLDVNGSFHLDANDLISSQVSVLFSKQMLNESPIGQKILKMVPQAWQMPFEFHLSGDYHRMNFQWDDSILKRKIEQHLPNFVERSIERKMDEKVAT